jgi:hypothetical protein
MANEKIYTSGFEQGKNTLEKTQKHIVQMCLYRISENQQMH